MWQHLRAVWEFIRKAFMAVGEFVSAVILTVFYYTLFAVCALPLAIFKNPFTPTSTDTNFKQPARHLKSRADFADEA